MLTTPVSGAVSINSAESPTEQSLLLDTGSSGAQFQANGNIDAQILNYYQDSGEFVSGDRVSAQVQVRNTGDSRHTFFVGYSVQGPNGNWYDNNRQTGETVTLNPNEREWIQLSWTVENSAPTGDYDAITSIWAESDPDDLQTRLDDDQKYDSFRITESTEIDARITRFDADSGEYQVGDSVDATTIVENTGDTEHTFFVGYSTTGPDGQYYDNNDRTGQTVTLDPGEERPVDLEWDVEDGASSGDYDVLTSVWEESDRDDLQTRLDDERRSNTFEIVEATEIGAQIVNLNVDSGDMRIGDRVGAVATVENTGNVEHTFFIGYSTIGPDGEYYDNDEQTGKTVTLDPGERRQVYLDWTVTSSVPTGNYDALVSVWEESDRDNLQSRLDDSRRYDSFEIVETTDIDAQINDVNIASGEFQRSDSVSTTAIIKNTGNTKHTFFVGYSVRGPDGNYYDNDDETGRTVTLDPGEQRSVSLEWEVQSEAQPGDYDTTVSVWAEADSDDLQTRLDDSQRNNAFEIIQQDQIEAQISEFNVQAGEFGQADTIAASTIVENTGNTEHTFFVGFSVLGPDRNSYDNNGATGKVVTLAPGERHSVSLEWSVEDGATSGQYDALVSVWEESNRENLQTRLDDTLRENVFDVQQPEVGAQITELNVVPNEVPQGGTVELATTVENTGNSQQSFFLEYSIIGPDGTTYYREDSGTFQIESRQQRSLSFTWSVESQIPYREYDLKMSVWESSATEQLVTEETRSDVLTAVDQASGRIQELSVPNSYEPGETYPVEVQIYNPANIEHTYTVSPVEDSAIQFEDGGGTEITVESGGSKTVSFPMTFSAESGSQNIQVELRTTDGSVVDSASREVAEPSTSLVVYAIDTNGDPISGVPVDPFLPDLEPRETDTNGKVEYNGDWSGDAIIFVEDLSENGLVASKSSPTYRANFEQGQSTEVIAEFERAVTVTGSVRRVDGTALSDVSVRIPGENVDVDVGSDGEFEFQGLEPGTYYTFEVWRGSNKLSSDVRRFDQGQVTLPLEISSTEIESSGNFRDQLSYAARNMFDDTTERKRQIFGNNTVIVGSDPVSQQVDARPYFVTEDGGYRTTGPCAWHSTRSECELYRTSTAERKASNQGVVDGFSTGLAETITGFEQLTRPVEYTQSIIELVLTVMGDIGLLDDLIAQIPQEIQEKQQQDNDYSQTEETKLYDAYREGWYAGYITYFVVSSYFGSSAAKALKTSDRVSDAADRLDDLSNAKVREALEFETRLRTNNPKKARYYIDTPSGVSTQEWREVIGRIADNPAVPNSQLNRYLRASKAVRNNNKIANQKELFTDVIDQGGDRLTGSVLETERAVVWANRKSVERVVVEPNEGNVFDLEIRNKNGEIEYVEVKNTDPTKGPMDKDKLRNKMREVNDQIYRQSFDTSGGKAVATIGTKKLSDDIASQDQLRRVIRERLDERPSPPQFERVRIVAGSGKNQLIYTFDIDDFDVNYPNAQNRITPSMDTIHMVSHPAI